MRTFNSLPKMQTLCRLKVAVTVMSALIIGGCDQNINDTPAIIPCYTSIDRANFDSRSDIIKFLDVAIPLGSNEACAFRVMRGNKVYFDYQDYSSNSEKTIMFTEWGWMRFRMFFSIGYDRKLFWFYYNDKKLSKTRVN